VVGQERFPWGQPETKLACDHEALSRLVGQSSAFRHAIEKLPFVAGSDATTVITGETGTGKELVARAVHYLGPRAPYPFVPVNCGALPDSLLEDELFGHERGAFTDARKRRAGLVSQAQHGTLFLDEIDSLSPRAQVALLRVLQDGSYRVLGGEREQAVNVRFVAATNACLSDLVDAGRFRSDLYYRLCVLSIALPPLRDRVDDILPLAVHFIAKYQRDAAAVSLSTDAERALLAYSWPGNVRELENAIQRTMAMSGSSVIVAADLGLAPAPPAIAVATKADAGTPLRPFNEAKRDVIDAFERTYLTQALRAHRGNVSRAAKSARKERRDFGRLLKKHQLNPRQF
jgi:DNA-binding NtrC family response regulator